MTMLMMLEGSLEPERAWVSVSGNKPPIRIQEVLVLGYPLFGRQIHGGVYGT